MNILVPDGAGFIWSHIADSVIELGHHVTIMYDLSMGNMNNINKCITIFKNNI